MQTTEPQREQLLLSDQLDRGAAYHLLNSIVVPRPIAWVSTCNSSGTTNLAPHSYFSVASVNPATLMFVSIGVKDTLINVRDTGCFVINVVNESLASAMNDTAANAPFGVSEFELANIEIATSATVAAPRVAQAPVSIECELDRIIQVGDDPSFIVLGTVSAIHIKDAVINEQGRVDASLLQAVARMGGAEYTTSKDVFRMDRPTYQDLISKN